MGSQKSSIELFLCPAGDRRQSLERGLAAGSLADAADAADAKDARPLSAFDPGGDPNSLLDQGWGVIAPRGDDGDRLLELVRPLLAKRAADQDGEVPVYHVPPGLTAAQSATWIDRILVGNELHEDVPGYLLVLGTPDQVSFELQQVITGGFSVGRLGFTEDAHYEAYVDKLLRHERAPAAPARAVYFTARDGTPATDLGHRMLIQPCIADAEQQRDAGRFAASEIAVVEGDPDDPTRAADGLLAAARERAVLLSCSHGAGAPRQGWDSAERRHAVQGALCLGGGAHIEAPDLARVPFLPGGMWMMFACFGAGTPAHSAYHHWLARLSRHGAHEGELSALLASLPREGEPAFLAALPQAALANPDGPLAIIGHLDLAWSYGFHDLEKMSRGERHRRFHEIVAQLAKGSRVGLALGGSLMRTRSQIENELAIAADDDARAAERAGEAGDLDLGRQIRLGHRCMLLQDLNGYIALGDPAARMAVSRPGREAPARPAPSERPVEVRSMRADAPTTGAPDAPTTGAPDAPALDAHAIERAVHDLIAGTATLAQIAERHQVPPTTASEWRRAYTDAGLRAVAALAAAAPNGPDDAR